MRARILIVMLTACSLAAFAQGNVGIGTGTPDGAAQLDVTSPAGSDRGVLIPRISIGNVNTWGLAAGSGTESMLVYNTNASTTGGQGKGFYYWNGSKWVKFVVGVNTDIAWVTIGNTGTTASTSAIGTTVNNNFLGTTDGADFVMATQNLERMRITSTGNVGIGTITPTSSALLTINPTSNALRTGIDMTLTNATSTATGLNITTGNSFVNGITVTHSSSAAATYYGVAGKLTSVVSPVAAYLAYHTGTGNTAANYFAGYFQGKTAITSDNSPTSTSDFEIQNTTAGNTPVTFSMRPTTEQNTSNTDLAELNFGDSRNNNPQAQISVTRDATGTAGSGSTDLPTSLSFWTTPDGSNIITERVRISNSGNVGIGIFPANNSALLDISSSSKGVRLPNVALTGTTDAATIASPATSLLVYNTATAGSSPTNVTPGYYYNSGTSGSPVWKRFSAGNSDAWIISGNENTSSPGNPGTYGTSTIGAAENLIGARNNVDVIFGTNNQERMRIKNDGRISLGTASPAANYLLTLQTSSATNGSKGISISMSGGSGDGIYLGTNASAYNGLTFDHGSTSTSTAFYGVGGTLSSTNIVSGYLGYRNSSGLSYGVFGVNGTPGSYTTSASTWAAWFKGRTVISSENSPTSPLGVDLEIRNTSTGSGNPATLSLRQSSNLSTSGNILANLNFGDNYQTAPQAQIQVLRPAGASSTSDLPTAFSFYSIADANSTLKERMRISGASNNTSEVWVNSTSPYVGDVFSATSNVDGDYGVNGYNTSTTASTGGGIYGEGRAALTAGVWGFNSHSSGTGSLGSGQNQSTGYLVAGSGGAFTGNTTGLYALNNSCGVGEAIYTVNGAVGSCNVTCRVNYWNGSTQYKILGSGSVSTIAKTPAGNKVVLHAPETPEIYFQDYGNGKLVNGKAHIDIDPIMTHNIVVDENHPLQVFIQLNGDCKGVFVSNRSATGFDVTELQGGTSNAEFTWSLTANRADEELAPGKISKNADIRFEPAPEDKEVNVLPQKETKKGTVNY